MAANSTGLRLGKRVWYQRFWCSLRCHAHLAREFTGETPVPLFKLQALALSKGREALLVTMQDTKGSDLVFSIDRNGVGYDAIRAGFETACDNAEIIYGQTKPGGLTWHDLRHAFATRLRAEGVHELDIMPLMGHSSVGVTAGYAHTTPAVIQSAVNKLAVPRGEVVQFARKAG